MFTFTKKFWHNSKSQRGTLLLANFVNFLILAIIVSLIMIPFTVVLQSFYMSAMMGQASINSIIFIIIAFLVLGCLLFIFLMYPLLTGSIRTFYNAYHPEKQLKFTDIFKTFTGARWLKAVKLALFVLLILILSVVINGLFSNLLSFIFQKTFTSPDMINNNLILIIVVGLIVSFLLSMITWFVLIFIINMTTAYVDNPQHKIIDIIKLGWSGIFNKQKTFLKFFIGILIINLVLLLISIPGNYYQFFLKNDLSFETIRYIGIIISIVYALIRFLFYLVMTGIIVQYFMSAGKKEA